MGAVVVGGAAADEGAAVHEDQHRQPGRTGRGVHVEGAPAERLVAEQRAPDSWGEGGADTPASSGSDHDGRGPAGANRRAGGAA